jgi:hypothetical protein
MSVMGATILGTPGPYVYPKIFALEYAGRLYQIPRLRFGDIHAIRSNAQIHQDVPFSAPEWPKEREVKLDFMVRCQMFRGMMVTALNRVYLWEEFFRAYIGRPMRMLHPIVGSLFYGVLTDMAYTEVDGSHVIMSLTFVVCSEEDLVPESMF